MMNKFEIEDYVSKKTGYLVKAHRNVANKSYRIEISADGSLWRSLENVYADDLEELNFLILQRLITSGKVDTYHVNVFGKLLATIIEECLSGSAFDIDKNRLVYVKRQGNLSDMVEVCAFDDVQGINVARNGNKGIEQVYITVKDKKIVVEVNGTESNYRIINREGK